MSTLGLPHLTPGQAYAQIKDSLHSYLSSQYRIAHPLVWQERKLMLDELGTIAQEPFIESTPAFPPGHTLSELEAEPGTDVPQGLAELIGFGVPMDKFPLYAHQEAALLAASRDERNLLIATGTGSGKTESFLLPILGRLISEARTWTAPASEAAESRWDSSAQHWLHSRRHETRPAAIRAIILYPMNALVNDQLQRLRRIFARANSPEWQEANFNGNTIHFGMYTGLSKPAGAPSESWRRDRYREYLSEVRSDWAGLSDNLRETGIWPRPDGPEMLCRWDMQLAPPDVLVTNYSMLEYMLVRPIESEIFNQTKKWLDGNPEAKLTLVLDEAHTYAGAKGTEVAFLIRRLKERLGLSSGSDQIQAIATSASIPSESGSDSRLSAFVGDLFGEPQTSFSIIRIEEKPVPEKPKATDVMAQAYAALGDTFDLRDPYPSIAQLASDLGLAVDLKQNPAVSLHQMVKDDAFLLWVRARTARRATQLQSLADECWSGVEPRGLRERALAGVLAAGAFARPSPTPDIPPLLSMRLHGFFRGVTGIWACMDPNCPEVRVPGVRPVGRLYADPRPWCACGARVLEVFSCRKCGLMFLGGIPAAQGGSLWPWTDDLSGDRQDLGNYRVFGVESIEGMDVAHRSTRTSLPSHPGDSYSRETLEIKPAQDSGRDLSPYPEQCPRCRNYRAPGAFGQGREIVEPLRTIGSQAFAVLVDEAFRVQPRTDPTPPNFGRKALLFSDARQQAARLAPDMRSNHRKDAFRQLLMLALTMCEPCGGTGSVELEDAEFVIGSAAPPAKELCNACDGTGRGFPSSKIGFEELRRRVVGLEIARQINPNLDAYPDLFARFHAGDVAASEQLNSAFDLDLLREVSEEDFSLEHLGLGSWQVQIPPNPAGGFAPLSTDESLRFMRSVVRILATEKVLLPPKPQDVGAWEAATWDPIWDRPRTLIKGSGAKGNSLPFNLGPRRKLGRYVRAVSNVLERDGRLAPPLTAEKWLDDMSEPLWNALRGLNFLQNSGSAPINGSIPQGIRLDIFSLASTEATVERCTHCRYIMSEAVLQVCIRCGNRTESINPDQIANYYRTNALQALSEADLDDPYPLMVHEHTAQIGTSQARELERWFQDSFRDSEVVGDKRVDILSVTTTMEMGIDIGSLLEVGLGNIPPTVANYQQRAGRAGRRASALATVLAFAPNRSHDQYYFDHPPEIVSEPPRVPELYVNNPVIARRHVRALVLQEFFNDAVADSSVGSLFGTWGKVSQYFDRALGDRFDDYLRKFELVLQEKAKRIFPVGLHSSIPDWLSSLRSELDAQANATLDQGRYLFEVLLSSGLLPKYAFPVDVVTLSIPKVGTGQEESTLGGELQRDLSIALGEYAPGSQVVVGQHPSTSLFTSAAVYDPFNPHPDHSPTGILVECQDCQAIESKQIGSLVDDCSTCGGINVVPYPYLRPKGFSIDASLGQRARRVFTGGSTERSGATSPARLLVGATSFESGMPVPGIPKMLSYVHTGNLFVINKGPNKATPGFLICPICGRSLDPVNPGPHVYPASIPPFRGPERGPTAGAKCPNTTEFSNSVVLGHEYQSEVLLLGFELDPEASAPLTRPHGAAIWSSTGTLLSKAAALQMQIDPSEIRVSVRPVRREGIVQGEIYIYDTVPGGAGYARAINDNLDSVLHKAMELGLKCENGDCGGACYRCLLDYRNQSQHHLLDRQLGVSLLSHIVTGHIPLVDMHAAHSAAKAACEFAPPGWSIEPEQLGSNSPYAVVISDTTGQRIGIWVTHPLWVGPNQAEREEVLAESGIRPAVHNLFDLQRRPFWVMNNLLQ